MRIMVDRSRCEGHAQCEAVAPSLFHVGDDGDLTIHDEGKELPAANVADAENAVMACPVMALSIEP